MTGRICKHEGCARPARGRGMCGSHYSVWLKAHPDMTIMKTNRQAMLDAMPGTARELVERTGLTRETVAAHLAVLNVTGKERQAYIARWIPPMKKGDNWKAVYYEGAKGNKLVTKKEKHRHYLDQLNAQRAAKRVPAETPRRRPPDPAPRASWFDALPVAA